MGFNKMKVIESFDIVVLALAHNTASAKGTLQKLLSGFFIVKGGVPPLSAKLFEHNDCPLRGGEVPPNSVKEKIR